MKNKYNPDPQRLEFCREKQAVYKKPPMPPHIKLFIIISLVSAIIIGLAYTYYFSL